MQTEASHAVQQAQKFRRRKTNSFQQQHQEETVGSGSTQALRKHNLSQPGNAMTVCNLLQAAALALACAISTACTRQHYTHRSPLPPTDAAAAPPPQPPSPCVHELLPHAATATRYPQS